MSTLADAVEARYSSEVLRQLTNPYDPSASGIDDTKLEAAASAVAGWFPIYAQAELDVTDPVHLDVAVDGVIMLLQKWGGTATGVAAVTREAWVEACREVRNTGARSRIEPQTNSPELPEDPVTTRPAEAPFSQRMWEPLIPGRSVRRSSDLEDQGS